MAVTAIDSAFSEERFRFSRGGGFVGVTTADGRLVVIDAQVNVVRSEFVPSSHLATACTCLAWRPHEEESHDEEGHKKLVLSQRVYSRVRISGYGPGISTLSDSKVHISYAQSTYGASNVLHLSVISISP